MSSRSEALHQRIRRDIEAEIRSGRWAAGQKIPFEHELMQAYGCSRMTVNKALGALSDAGLIETRKRAGSFVRSQNWQSTVLDIPDLQTDLQARGEAYSFVMINRSRHKASDPDEIELAGEGDVLRLWGVHRVSERPLAFEQRLINLSAVPEAALIDFNLQSPGHWLLEAVAWTRAEHEISAQALSPRACTQLKLSKGSVGLVIKRKTWREADRITSVTQSFDSAYHLSATLLKS